MLSESPRATSDEQRPIVDLVRQMLAASSAADTTSLERDIDRLVAE